MLPVAALVLVNVDQAHWEQVRDDIQALPGLEFLAFTSGSFDMVLLVRVPDIHALRDIVLVRLHGIPHVRTTHTNFVLDEQRLPLPIPEPPAGPDPSDLRRGRRIRQNVSSSTACVDFPVPRLRTLPDMTSVSEPRAPSTRAAPPRSFSGSTMSNGGSATPAMLRSSSPSGFGFARRGVRRSGDRVARPDVVRAARRARSASS